MPNPVVHFEITGKEGQQLQSFYAQLFDWKIDANNEFHYGLVSQGDGHSVTGGIGPSDGPNRVTVYVQVDDLQAYLDKAERLGGKTVMPPMEIPNMVTMAMFADPQGNVIGLLKG